MNVSHNEGGHGHVDEHRGHHHHEHPHPDQGLHVTVIYNGVTKRVEFKYQESLGTLRQQAISAFGDLPTPHLLSLFSASGVEFVPALDQKTVRDAGIHNGDQLLLRPGVVRGG
jgi:hypothetical protein